MKRICARAVATLLFIGTIPGPSGTWGSIATLGIYYLIHGQQWLLVLSVVVSFAAGIWSSREVELMTGKEDPGEIVIDEACGMLITFLWVPFSVPVMIIGLILFRVFDITKPWPIRNAECLKNGVGVMLDDVIAGIFANIGLQATYYALLAGSS